MRDNPKAVRILMAILDAGPYIVIGVAFLIGLASLIALLVADVYVGQIAGEHQTKDWIYGWLISLAGTGMIVTAFGLWMEGQKKDWDWRWVYFFLVCGVALQLTDCYFDATTVDIRRFGEIVIVKNMIASGLISAGEAQAFNLYRGFVAGISLIGEPAATAAVLFFPAMKQFLRGVFGASEDHDYEPVRPSTNRRPLPIPRPSQGGYGHYKPVVPDPAYRPSGMTRHEESS